MRRLANEQGTKGSAMAQVYPALAGIRPMWPDKHVELEVLKLRAEG
jgi:hypothetical protein